MGQYVNRFELERAEDNRFDLRMFVSRSPSGDLDPHSFRRRILEVPDDAILRIRATAAARAQITFVADPLAQAGFSLYRLVRTGQPAENPAGDGESIENEYFRLSPSPRGLKIDDLKNNQTLEIYFEDDGDRGDEYNFDPVADSAPISTPASISARVTERGAVRSRVAVSFVYNLPAALTKDRKNRAPETVEVRIHLTATIYARTRADRFRRGDRQSRARPSLPRRPLDADRHCGIDLRHEFRNRPPFARSDRAGWRYRRYLSDRAASDVHRGPVGGVFGGRDEPRHLRDRGPARRRGHDNSADAAQMRRLAFARRPCDAPWRCGPGIRDARRAGNRRASFSICRDHMARCVRRRRRRATEPGVRVSAAHVPGTLDDGRAGESAMRMRQSARGIFHRARDGTRRRLHRARVQRFRIAGDRALRLRPRPQSSTGRSRGPAVDKASSSNGAATVPSNWSCGPFRS